MNLELDHVFILVEPEAKVADLLLAKGIREGRGNQHPGQGTSNRCFYFANGMLEFLWVHDAEEAFNGFGRDLYLSERAKDPLASPFGVILRRKDNSSLEMPGNTNPITFFGNGFDHNRIGCDSTPGRFRCCNRAIITARTIHASCDMVYCNICTFSAVLVGNLELPYSFRR